jgi:hypothetical protein
MKSAIVSVALVHVTVVMADLRIKAGSTLKFRTPETFGFAALNAQKANALDNFIRSNIDNEANQRNVNNKNELAQDMLPCRSDILGQTNTWTRGQPVTVPLRWNNPHDSSCEVNAWVQNFSQVAPIKRPFNCGGGFQDNVFNFTIPEDFPGCSTAADGCVLQIYGHSVEPRTYAICLDFTLTGQAPAPTAQQPA